MNDSRALVDEVVRAVLERIQRPAPLIPLGISNRHVHLIQEHLETLFGLGYRLKEMRPLSQPGEFAAVETVVVAGPKGALFGVRILGPTRKRTQVEVSRTDAFALGLCPPVRDSGDLDGTPGAALIGPKGTVVLSQGLILAKRHLHLTPEDAEAFGVSDKQLVGVRFGGDRSLTLGAVLCRVSPNYKLELHLDTDEANAALAKNGDLAALELP
jgi:putative phosphotransacetylase